MADDRDLRDLQAAGWELSADTIAANERIGRLVAEANQRHDQEKATRADGSKRKRSTVRDPQGEDLMQIRVIEWARRPETLARLPELRWLYHTPNAGHRSGAEAAMFARLGTLAGIPDLILPVARGGWHGWYGELKWGKNSLSKAQAEFIEFAQAQGYRARTYWDEWQFVADDLERYLSGAISRRAIDPAKE